MSNTNVKEFVEACRNKQMKNFERQKQVIIDEAINGFMKELHSKLADAINITVKVDKLFKEYNCNRLYSHNQCTNKCNAFDNVDTVDLLDSMIINFKCHMLSHLASNLSQFRRYYLLIIQKELTNTVLSRENLRKLLEKLDYSKECTYITDMYAENISKHLESFISKFNFANNVNISLQPSEDTQ